jgi:hypothetical protein
MARLIIESEWSNWDDQTSPTTRRQEENLIKIFPPTSPKHIPEIVISQLERLPRA